MSDNEIQYKAYVSLPGREKMYGVVDFQVNRGYYTLDLKDGKEVIVPINHTIIEEA